MREHARSSLAADIFAAFSKESIKYSRLRDGDPSKRTLFLPDSFEIQDSRRKLERGALLDFE